MSDAEVTFDLQMRHGYFLLRPRKVNCYPVDPITTEQAHQSRIVFMELPASSILHATTMAACGLSRHFPPQQAPKCDGTTSNPISVGGVRTRLVSRVCKVVGKSC
jgi:hypothetical protein